MDFLIDYLIGERDEKINVPQDYFSKRNLLRCLMNVRPPLKISDDFLMIQDEFLTAETLGRDLTAPSDITEVKGKIMLWQGDITTLKVDAVVNAANSKLLGCFIPLHGCIDNAIHSAAGLQLRDECSRIIAEQGRDEEVGCAKITGGYNLPAGHVIHTVGPAIPQGLKPSEKDCGALADCYKSCLEIATCNNLKSLAFCCISTGVFNFPNNLAAEIAVETVGNYLDSTETSLNHIIFDVFDDTDYLIYKRLLFGD